jgi:hypothetical protein
VALEFAFAGAPLDAAWAAGGAVLLAPLVSDVADAASVVLLRPAPASALYGAGITAARVQLSWCRDAQTGAVAVVASTDPVNAAGVIDGAAAVAAGAGTAAVASGLSSAGRGLTAAAAGLLSPSPGFVSEGAAVGFIASVAVAVNASTPLNSTLVIEELLAYLRRDASAVRLQALASGVSAAAAAPFLSLGGALQPAWVANARAGAGLRLADASAGAVVSLAGQPPLRDVAAAPPAPVDSSDRPSAGLLGGICGAAAIVLALSAAALFVIRRQRRGTAQRRARITRGGAAAAKGDHADAATTSAGARQRHLPPLAAVPQRAGAADGKAAPPGLLNPLRRQQQRVGGGNDARLVVSGGGLSARSRGGDTGDFLQFSANPLASRSALSFAPTMSPGTAGGGGTLGGGVASGASLTAGCSARAASGDASAASFAGRKAGVAPTPRAASRAAAALSFASGGAGSRPGSAGSARTAASSRPGGRQMRRPPQRSGSGGARRGCASDEDSSLSSLASVSDPSGSSDSESEAAVRARARRAMALRRKSRVELRAVPTSASDLRTASAFASAKLGASARTLRAAVPEAASGAAANGGEAAAAEPALPHGACAPAGIASALTDRGGGAAGMSHVNGAPIRSPAATATAGPGHTHPDGPLPPTAAPLPGVSPQDGAGAPASSPAALRRAVALEASAGRETGGRSAKPGLRDLKAYKATSVRSLKTALTASGAE